MFVTRAAGGLTTTLPPSEFASLPAKAASGEVHLDKVRQRQRHGFAVALCAPGSPRLHLCLPWQNTDMYFEDDVPWREVSQLCSLSCQTCAATAKVGAPPPPKFPTLQALQQHLRAEHKQHMCSICLQGRNVFIAQQLLYTQSALDKHLVSGTSDAGNPLGQAGFKGHPMCRFCGSHFFDDGQLYVHMQREHFQCFLCQRAAPDSSSPVYYRNYDELEHHFRKEHCLCDHPLCLQKKFVAFASVMELQRHTALEHKSELSKDARRAALRANDLLGFVSSSPVANAAAVPMPRGRGTRSGLANQAVAQLGVSAEQLARLRAQAQAEAAAAAAASRSRATLIDDTAPTPAETYGLPRSASNSDMSTGPTLAMAARWATPANVGQGGGVLATSSAESFPSLQRSSSSNSLPGASAASSQRTRQQPSSAGRSMADFLGGEGRGAPGVRVVAAPPPPPPAVSSNGGPASGEAAQAANAALARRIQGMLPLVTREEDFALFRSLSARFRGGQLGAGLYYDHITAMGLGPCIPDLAALLPDAAKRQELLAVAASRSASTAGGVPRRPAASAASIAAQAPRGGVRVLTPAWTCGACTLENAAGTDVCAACGGRRRPADGEGVSALAVALEAAMRTGGSRGKDKKVAVVQAPSRVAPDTPGPSRHAAPAAVAPEQRADPAAFPALQSGAPLAASGRRKKSVGVQPGNQWTQGRPL